MFTDNSSVLILRNDVAGANMAFFWKPWRTLLQPMNDSGLRYWIGLERLHELTQANCGAVFDLQAYNGSWYRAAYTNFTVADAADNFRIHIGGYSGNAGDAMAYHNGMRFSTYDRDNDMDVYGNCAGQYWGAFWFNNCFNAAITVWPEKYFYWFVAKFDKIFLKVVEMRIVC